MSTMLKIFSNLHKLNVYNISSSRTSLFSLTNITEMLFTVALNNQINLLSYVVNITTCNTK
jgi:hypothetical protein